MHPLPVPITERLIAQRSADLLPSRRPVATNIRMRPPNRLPRTWRRRYL